MATPLTTATIGQDLYCLGDLIFDDQAGPSAATVTSSEFKLANTLGSTQVKIVAGTDGLVTGSSNRVTIKVITAPASGGTFDNTVVEQLLPVSTTYAAGDTIFSYIPAREETEVYAKISATVATDDLSAYDLTAYQVAVA